MLIRIDIDGKPVPQGSMSAIPFSKPCGLCRSRGRPCGRKTCIAGREIGCNVVQSGEVKTWRSIVGINASVALNRHSIKERPWIPEGGVILAALFRLQRPQSHRTARGALNAEGERNPDPSHKPDGDKLLRAILDALTEVAYKDDAQVCVGPPVKIWAPLTSGPSVTILVGPKLRGFSHAAFGAEMDKLVGPPPIGDLFG